MGDFIDFALSNARRFYLSKGKNLAAKGLKRYRAIERPRVGDKAPSRPREAFSLNHAFHLLCHACENDDIQNHKKTPKIIHFLGDFKWCPTNYKFMYS